MIATRVTGDVADVLAASWFTAFHLRAGVNELQAFEIAQQVSEGVAFRFDADGEPVALAGFWPRGALSVCWFGCRRDKLSRRMTSFVRLARVIIGQQRKGAFGLPCETITIVEPGNRPGEKLARLLGFCPSDDFIKNYRVWL